MTDAHRTEPGCPSLRAGLTLGCPSGHDVKMFRCHMGSMMKCVVLALFTQGTALQFHFSFT